MAACIPTCIPMILIKPNVVKKQQFIVLVQTTPAQSPENLKILGAFFVYRKILEASARFPLHVHALVQGFSSDSATPLGHPTASPVLEVNADQNQLLH